MAGAVFLADTSVHVLQGRHQAVRRRFEALLMEGRLAVCEMTCLEYLNNASDPESYEQIWDALHSQRWLEVTGEAMGAHSTCTGCWPGLASIGTFACRT
jgi:predicted nucleic acid-binding protein